MIMLALPMETIPVHFTLKMRIYSWVGKFSSWGGKKTLLGNNCTNRGSCNPPTRSELWKGAIRSKDLGSILVVIPFSSPQFTSLFQIGSLFGTLIEKWKRYIGRLKKVSSTKNSHKSWHFQTEMALLVVEFDSEDDIYGLVLSFATTRDWRPQS